MQLLIEPGGRVRCIYDELIPLAALGDPVIRRASHVEPTAAGWRVDLAPSGGPGLGPFTYRSQALAAEHVWLLQHWLEPPLIADGIPEAPS